jgi:hypothetical protein
MKMTKLDKLKACLTKYDCKVTKGRQKFWVDEWWCGKGGGFKCFSFYPNGNDEFENICFPLSKIPRAKIKDNTFTVGKTVFSFYLKMPVNIEGDVLLQK